MAEGPAQPFEKARFSEGKSLDFPSLRLGFSFPRLAQKENSSGTTELDEQ